jgi:oxygen-independent coproporphyrinogen-3 oxidase
VFPRSLEDEYQSALVAEIERHLFKWRPGTVFLGGGTPSSMELPALRSVLEAIPGRPWKEATLEASPGTITGEKARAWAAAGVNRVSLGVQSFVREEIAATGRKHTAETVVTDLETLRAAGIMNYNIDLIAGLAGQTMASWRQSLDWIARLAPPHVSVYMLEIDDDSRYEISNFARPGFESLHNLKYWQLEPYIGFGADAHSFDGTERWQNAESPSDYVAAADSAERIAANLMEERFFVGLRLTRGIRPSQEEWRRFEAPVRRFVGEGLLETEGDRLRLTSRGVLLSNEVFQEFLNL